MNSLWVALIAVGGTLAGAAIAPIVNAIRKGSARRDRRRAARHDAALDFTKALQKLAERPPKQSMDGGAHQSAWSTASSARMALLRELRLGEGRADDFTEFGMRHMDAYAQRDDRIVAANYIARRTFEWLRGDRKVDTLRPFVVEHGLHGMPVIFERSTWADALDDGPLERGEFQAPKD